MQRRLLTGHTDMKANYSIEHNSPLDKLGDDGFVIAAQRNYHSLNQVLTSYWRTKDMIGENINTVAVFKLKPKLKSSS